MYAGKIHLIGTEQGVGVRNAGHIGASADTLTIDSQGRIVNSGTFNAQRQVQLNAQHGIDNQGKIENKQGNIQLNSKADIQNSGSIVARGGNIQKKPKLKSSKVAKRSQKAISPTPPAKFTPTKTH